MTSANDVPVAVADSAGGNRYTMPADEFQEKWGDLKMGGVSTGLSNVMISTVPNGSYSTQPWRGSCDSSRIR